MPKVAFYKLDDSKKNKLEEVLFEVFSSKHISVVKVSEIVSKMDMARGSFYNYFESLEDAEAYTIQITSREIHEKMMSLILANNQDFFEGIRKYLLWFSGQDDSNILYFKNKYLLENEKLDSYKRIKYTVNKDNFWLEFLKKTDLNYLGDEKATALLYMMMDMIRDLQKAYLVNDWHSEDLLKEYNLRVDWLKNGIR